MASRGEFFARPWDSQPQEAVGVDWSNELTRGVIDIWSPSHGLRGVASGRELEAFNTLPAVAVDPAGLAWDITSTNRLTTSANISAGRTNITVFALFRPTAAAAFGNFGAVAGDLGAILQFDHNDGNYRESFTIQIGGSYPYAKFAATTAGKLTLWVGTYDGTTVSAYTDGVLTGSAAASGALVSSSEPWRIGSREGAYPFAGKIIATGVLGTAWSAAQVRGFADRSWQLFAPRRISVPVSAAGGGASAADLASTGGTGTFSGTANSTTTATLATTGSAGTFAGTASSPATATVAVTGATGAFSGTASTTATATLAATGATGTFAATANSTTTAALATTGSTGTFAGSAGSNSSASLAALGGEGAFAGSAYPLTSAQVAALGGTGTFSGLASTVGTATLDATGGTGAFSGTAVSIGSAFLAALGDSGIFVGSASVAAPSTIGRPASDTSNAGWSASTGSDLFAMLDETTPDPADYIVATSLGAVCELALGATAYPGTASQVLKFRASSSTGNSVIVRLRNTGGATVRTATQALTSVDTEYSITLTAGEIAAITSGALSVQLESA